MDTKVELTLAIKSAKNAVLENDFLKAKGFVEKCVNILNGIYRKVSRIIFVRSRLVIRWNQRFLKRKNKKRGAKCERSVADNTHLHFVFFA